MAEASCSGSTPFKGLVDHQSRDNGLHRDRPRLGTTNTEHFRSQQTARPGQDGFNAFLQNQTLPSSEALGVRHTAVPHPSAYGQQQAGWPTRQGPATLAPQAPIYSNATGPSDSAWAAEYSSSNIISPGSSLRATTLASFNPGHRFIPPPSLNSIQGAGSAILGPPSLAVGLGAPSRTFQSMQNTAPAEMLLSDVDDVLKQIAEELERSASQEQSVKDKAAGETTSMTQTLGNSTHLTETAVETAEKYTDGEDHGKSSEVSEIAKRILETVNHEDEAKWRESTFLALMRDFRDGKKVIVGDTIRES